MKTPKLTHFVPFRPKGYLTINPALTTVLALIALVLALLMSGCSMGKSDYIYAPTLVERGINPNLVINNATSQTVKAPGIPLTDADILTFVSDLGQAWRRRETLTVSGNIVNQSVIAGLTTGAAVSAAPALPFLAAAANWLGSVSGLVDPHRRENAFDDGIALLLSAQSEYWNSMAGDGLTPTVASGVGLSKPGALLLQRVNSAISAVDKALLNRIATQTEINSATANVPQSPGP